MTTFFQDQEDILLSFFGWWLNKHHESDYSFSLFPSPRSYSRALADLVHELGWRRFAVIYEDEEALASRLTGVLELQGRKEAMAEEEGGDDDDDDTKESRQTKIATFRLPEDEKEERWAWHTVLFLSYLFEGWLRVFFYFSCYYMCACLFVITLRCPVQLTDFDVT